ncbi:MAG: outer membrane protein assembly factor BamC [Gammaproteobacteria bacterium]|nr:MAG: outer membrane protein assembly factor BamC [Gammaproteobacteria bacterium]
MPELKNTETLFMRRFLFVSRLLLPVVMLQLITACSFLDRMFPDRSKDYQKAEPARPLEVPPDLTTTTVNDALIVPSRSTTLSGYTSARETLAGTGGASPVLPGQESLRFERERDRAWLVVQGEPAAVWPETREFWLENGFFIMAEDPAVGVLETDWVANTESIPEGTIRGLISRAIPSAYSSTFQDRYRMRLERGEEPGTTEVFISHQGVEEVGTDVSGEGETRWEPRPKDPGLESIMLKRMMIFLGVQPQQAERLVVENPPAEDRAELIQQDSEQAVLLLHEDYSRAWRNVGIVLDRIDFAVEDRDRLQGIYYVRYNDPLKGQQDKGLLSKLAFWSSDDDREVQHLQIKLTDDGDDTRVVVLNSEDEHETSVTAVRILTLLFNELK